MTPQLVALAARPLSLKQGMASGPGLAADSLNKHGSVVVGADWSWKSGINHLGEIDALYEKETITHVLF